MALRGVVLLQDLVILMVFLVAVVLLYQKKISKQNLAISVAFLLALGH